VLPKSSTRPAGVVVAAVCIAVATSLTTSSVLVKSSGFKLDNSFADVSYVSYEVTWTKPIHPPRTKSVQ